MAFTNAERTSEAWTIDVPRGDVSQAAPPAVLLGERRPRYGEFALSPDGTRLAYTTSRARRPAGVLAARPRDGQPHGSSAPT